MYFEHHKFLLSKYIFGKCLSYERIKFNSKILEKLLFKSNPFETENKIPYFFCLVLRTNFQAVHYAAKRDLQFSGRTKVQHIQIWTLKENDMKNVLYKLSHKQKFYFFFFAFPFPQLHFTQVFCFHWAKRKRKNTEKNKEKNSTFCLERIICGEKEQKKNRTFMKQQQPRIVLNFLLVFFLLMLLLFIFTSSHEAKYNET